MILPPKRSPSTKPKPLNRLLAEPVYQDLPHALAQHGEVLPLGVMVRGVLEWLLDPPTVETLFHHHAPDHYTRELTISALVGLFIQVTTGARRSVHAAYKADRMSATPTIPTTYQALYGKLGRFPPAVSEAVVRSTAERCTQLLSLHPARHPEPVPGYRLRILDGNVLTGTDHRLTPLRRWLNACLPGKSLVVYEPGLGLVTDLVLEEDAYTQERALLTQVVPRLQPQDLIVADRNFGTSRFVFGVQAQKAFAIVRQHGKNLPCQSLSKRKKCGSTDTGVTYEQSVQVTDPASGDVLTLRRIELQLSEKTRDGDHTIAVLTNLPGTVSAVQIVKLYRERWTIEKNQADCTSSGSWCGLSVRGYNRSDGVGGTGGLVPGTPRRLIRRIRMSRRARRTLPPRT